MLARIISLHREGSGFDGEIRCEDEQLPIADRSLSLVHALFVLESSPDPQALLQEFARVLKPEGFVLLITLNSWSPTRLRWAIQGVSGEASANAENMAREAGLEVMRRHHLGPVWARSPRNPRHPPADPGANRLTDGLRAVSLLVLRHREAALTPLRKATRNASLRPGISVG
jgi:SAM-dependent methyltransferase